MDYNCTVLTNDAAWTVHKNRVVIDAPALAARNKEFVRKNKQTPNINQKIRKKDINDEEKFLKK